MWSEHRFLSFDGEPMFFRRLEAKSPRASMIVVHGMGEHGGRYTEFGEYLVSRGITCYLPDLRGFGKSGGKRGCVRSFDAYLRDLSSVWRTMASRQGNLPAFILGHSFGGLVVTHFLSENPEITPKGLVLTSPNFGIAIHVPAWRDVLGRICSFLAPDYTQGSRVVRSTLTHDMPHLQKHASDPLIHDRISARLYTELTAHIRASDDAASKITFPTLVFQAGDDRVVSKEATLQAYEKIASPDKALRVMDGLYHEVLNETSRHGIYREIADWVLQRA